MDVVITICIIGMCLLVSWTLANSLRKNRADRLRYFNNYKKGNFLFIYVISMPLYFLASLYENGSATKAIFDAFKSGVELVVLKFDYDGVSLLMGENTYFCVAMWICYALVVLNTAFLALTLFARRLENRLRCVRLKSNKRIYAVVGFNENSKSIIASVGDKGACVLLVDEITDEIKTFAFVNKLPYAKIQGNDLTKTLETLFADFSNKSVELIINTQDDSRNLVLCEQLAAYVTDSRLYELVADDARGLNAYVFADVDNMQLFLTLCQRSKGCLHYVNKYSLVARDFILKHPLTEYMGEEEIDYSTATIKEDVSLSVTLIGFGKTNQQLFLTSVANNQFMSLVGNELQPKPVSYYIYDKNDARNDKNLNHNYRRYENELASEPQLPLPGKPANEEFFELDINDLSFYKSLKKNLVSDNCEKKYNYLVIAFGTDLQNLDFAQKICEKLREWGAQAYTRVFVKVRSDDIKNGYTVTQRQDFVAFGNEKELVYNVSQIVDERVEAMARDRHVCYAVADKYVDMSQAANGFDALSDDEQQTLVRGWKKEAIEGWYAQSQTQRESNVYAILSLRMKLQLMGFDYVDKSARVADAREEYLHAYQQGDEIEYVEGLKPIEGRRIEKYTLDFVKASLRERMAMQEHQRWNAYMITCGFIPETLENIKLGRFKDFDIRRHSNLTTFEGLVEWRRLKAALTGRDEVDCDVIKYDYQLMDNAPWLLDKNGYKIVEKTR